MVQLTMMLRAIRPTIQTLGFERIERPGQKDLLEGVGDEQGVGSEQLFQGVREANHCQRKNLPTVIRQGRTPMRN